MGLLDDDPAPRWEPPKYKRYTKQSALSQENRDSDLNNHDKEEETEHYKQPE